MGSFTDYLEKKILNAVGGQDTLPSLTTYLALFTGAPGDTGGGTEVIGTGTNYSRVNFGNWATATSNFAAGTTVMYTSNTATFPTATSAWGTPSCFAVFDTFSGGNMLFHASLSSAKPVATSDIVQFATGSLTVGLD